jgi:hypothetical protein
MVAPSASSGTLILQAIAQLNARGIALPHLGCCSLSIFRIQHGHPSDGSDFLTANHLAGTHDIGGWHVVCTIGPQAAREARKSIFATEVGG